MEKLIKSCVFIASVVLYLTSLMVPAIKIINPLSGNPPTQIEPGWLILILGFFDIRWYANVFLLFAWLDFFLPISQAGFGLKKYTLGLLSSTAALGMNLLIFIPPQKFFFITQICNVYLGYYLWLASIIIAWLFFIVKKIKNNPNMVE